MIIELVERLPELEVLCKRLGVARLEAFGSAVTGAFRSEESDLDFLVEFSSPDSAGYADRYFELLEAMERLFGRPVDLVVASAVTNPYFLESLLKHKVLLYDSA